MNLNDIEVKIKNLIDNKTYKNSEFIYEFLLCFDLPKASITRLKKGDYNIAKDKTDILWKKKIFFKECSNNIYEEYSKAIDDEYIRKNEPLFIVLKDHKRILALDLQVNESIDIEIEEIKNNYTFFLPLAGMKKINSIIENPADTRAAEKMMKMYSEIKKENNFNNDDELHELNLFFARLLFCFFSEDTGIFEEKIFTKSIKMYTQIDGSDLYDFLNRIFIALDTEENKDEIEFIKKFPYVGGDLFGKMNLELKFNGKIRSLIIEIGELDWSEINPDIFGSMIQAVVNVDERANLGMHYTSVPNIMKVLNPLFLDSLNQEFYESRNDVKKLLQLIDKLSNINIFDPACGSGNFLVIAYKELRRLEMKIILQINKISPQQYLRTSTISINSFFGIEIDDFAHEIAIVSLWLIEHKMNIEFYTKFNYVNPTLPLQKSNNLIRGNATRLKWEEICPINSNKKTYIVGNPPYVGSKKQDKLQRCDMAEVFSDIKDYKNLDYISCWFYLGAKYIKKSNAELAFVSTNSIVQGEQVGLLWPNILSQGLEIGFANKSFKWVNNAKGKAAVICVIVSLRKIDKKEKYIISDGFKRKVENINPYLSEGKTVIVYKRKKQISNLPEMVYGNMPLEGGFLKLSKEEKNSLINESYNSRKFIRPLIGGEEFLNGIERYCLWIDDSELDEALKIKGIKERVGNVYNFRVNGGEVARTLVNRPHQFRYRKEASEQFIVVPCTSSENREYIQCGFYDSSYISLNSLEVIYDGEIYIFGIISSKIHMAWVKAIAGRLKLDYRYSNILCYNTFPFPAISTRRKNIIEECVYRILEVRENYSEKKIADLYDKEKMPSDLREAHRILDLEIDKCYRPNGFKNDDERLECLFNLYEEMV
ncbi:class I SAM-dependent DNA methyltransferase [Clostridium perfringens]|nr:class I SAM-dependent DNA methyltransferase [Clostridium perfringens]